MAVLVAPAASAEVRVGRTIAANLQAPRGLWGSGRRRRREPGARLHGRRPERRRHGRAGSDGVGRDAGVGVRVARAGRQAEAEDERCWGEDGCCRVHALHHIDMAGQRARRIRSHPGSSSLQTRRLCRQVHQTRRVDADGTSCRLQRRGRTRPRQIRPRPLRTVVVSPCPAWRRRTPPLRPGTPPRRALRLHPCLNPPCVPATPGSQQRVALTKLALRSDTTTRPVNHTSVVRSVAWLPHSGNVPARPGGRKG